MTVDQILQHPKTVSGWKDEWMDGWVEVKLLYGLLIAIKNTNLKEIIFMGLTGKNYVLCYVNQTIFSSFEVMIRLTS